MITYEHCTLSDVNALRFSNNFILAGIGGALQIFDILTSKSVFKETIFIGQKIHKIITGPHELVSVFGGRYISVITLRDTPFVISEKHTWCVSDWILDTCWMSGTKNIAVITANNNVTLWNWVKRERLQCASCEEKCIIYSASLLGTCWSDLVVLAGTVFQEVIVWSPRYPNDAVEDKPVLHRLKGHTGVIFSVRYDEKHRYIITTSDDRSVRMWQVRRQDGNAWKDATIHLQYTMYGHVARVWQTVSVPDGIISLGEDSYLCKWDEDCKLSRRWKTHQGGGVWCADYSAEYKLLVTGGNDSGICLWPQQSWKNVENTTVQLPSLEQDFPRRVVLTRSSRVVIISNNGTLMSSEIQDSSSWHVIYHDERLSNYSLLEISECRTMIALATLDGTIFIFKELSSTPGITSVLVTSAVEGKIFSLQWLNSSTIITCALHGKLEIWKVEGGDLVKKNELLLPKCKERWLTAVLLYENYLLCGDRQGSLHLYNLTESAVSLPCESLNSLHGHLGVSSLVLYGDRICSAGRDRCLRQFRLLEARNMLNCIRMDKLPIEWIASINSSSLGFYVLGFIETKFIVWDVNRNQSVFEVACGGGHRSWDCVLEDSATLTLVFIRNKTVHMSTCNLKEFVGPQLQEGFHHKTINSMKFQGSRVPLLVSASDDTTVRITTPTETNIMRNLLVLHSHISGVRALALHEYEKLSFVMFSAGCRAELKMWRLHLKTSTGDNELEDILCEEVCTHRLRDDVKFKHSEYHLIMDPETRYMDLAIFSVDKNIIILTAACSDGFVRFFHCDVMKGTLQMCGSLDFHKRCVLKISNFTLFSYKPILLTMATDGYVTFWDVGSAISTMSNFNKVQREEIINHSEDVNLEDLKPFSRLKVHQSGINCFDFRDVGPGLCLFATGGDDNTVILTLFEMTLNDDDSVSVNVLSQFADSSAHCAQVTGVHLTGDEMVTTGIDQRISFWRVTCSGSECSAVCTSQHLSSIPDIQGLQMWNEADDNRVCVYGKGMEIITRTDRKNSDKLPAEFSEKCTL